MEEIKFNLGIHGDYIYGYLFHSSLYNGNIVLDTGRLEYPVNDIEIWDGEKYSTLINLKNHPYNSFSGCKARILLSDLRTLPNRNYRCDY